MQTLQTGASYAVVDQDIHSENLQIIKVENVLQTVAHTKHHRQQFNIPFIAITGSNGKTTTKELVNAVLSSHYVLVPLGNLNNHIGIPHLIKRTQ